MKKFAYGTRIIEAMTKTEAMEKITASTVNGSGENSVTAKLSTNELKQGTDPRNGIVSLRKNFARDGGLWLIEAYYVNWDVMSKEESEKGRVWLESIGPSGVNWQEGYTYAEPTLDYYKKSKPLSPRDKQSDEYKAITEFVKKEFKSSSGGSRNAIFTDSLISLDDMLKLSGKKSKSQIYSR